MILAGVSRSNEVQKVATFTKSARTNSSESVELREGHLDPNDTVVPGKTAADCPSIVPAIDRATQRLTAMMTYLDANNADAHFKAAFCATGVDETACSLVLTTRHAK